MPEQAPSIPPEYEPAEAQGDDSTLPLEQFTPYNHPLLRHYSVQEIDEGDIESRDFELLRHLQDQ
jgi:hypothetical protein